MKQLLFLLLATTLTLCGCSEQDLAEIRAEQARIDARLSALEEWQKTVNIQISSIQSLVSALEDKDYVTGVSELSDGSGYVINFLKSGAVTIRNGAKGDKGDKGDAGTSGNVPNIGVKEDGGVYYWTLDGEYIKDNNGNPLHVTGEQGDAGEKGDNGIAPQVRINATNNEWEISTDGGSDWTPTGIKATGKDGTNGNNGTSCSITVNDSSNPIIVTITNTDAKGTAIATEIKLPLYKAFYIGSDAESQSNSALIITKTTTEIPLVLPGGFKENDYTAVMAQIISNKGTNTDIQTRAAADPWGVKVTKPTFTDGVCNNDAKVTVYTPTGIGASEGALLEVTLVGSDGGKIVSSRALKAGTAITPIAGDYYYSDGGISSQIISSKTPIGVVFYVGDVAKNDGQLKAKLGGGDANNYNSSDIHGLVVALKDASSNDYIVAWGASGVQIGNNTMSGYTDITATKGTSGTVNQMLGYNNTEVIREYNKGKSGDALVTAVSVIDENTCTDADNNKIFPKAPTGSSGWYLPSVKELSTLCSGWNELSDEGVPNGSSSDTDNFEIVNNALSALGSTVAVQINDFPYFSSSESWLNPVYYALIVNMSDGRVWSHGDKSVGNGIFLRPVLAF